MRVQPLKERARRKEVVVVQDESLTAVKIQCRVIYQ